MSRLLIRGAALLDANYDSAAMDIFIENDRITAVGNHLTECSDYVLDLTGYTLIPGLVNAHTHIQCAHDYTDEKYMAMARAGVCLCHDQGFLVNEPLADMVAWAEQVNADPSFPAIDFAGRYIAVAGGYGDVNPGGFQVGEIVTNEDECRMAVDYLARSGARCIKIGMDQGKSSLEDAITLPDSFVKAICDQAKSLGLRIGAHVHELEYLKRLVHGGITEAAHIVRQSIPQDLMDEMLANNIYLTATLTNFFRHKDRYSADDLQNSVDNVKRYWQQGGVVAVATDFMWPFEQYMAPLEEMRLFRLTGMTTRDIIVCATLNGAIVSNLADNYGTLEPGKLACMLAVKGPIDDNFNVLESPAFVMNRGKILVNHLEESK